MPNAALAVDLGGTQVRVALVDRNGTILVSCSERTRGNDGPETVVGQIVDLAHHITWQAGAGIAGIGVSAPGPLDTRRGVVLALQSMRGFDGYPIRDALEKQLKANVLIENDGIAAAIGEWRHGAGRQCTDFVYVTISTGIGGGIICNNRPVRGKRGLAGHVGHMFFKLDTPRAGGGTMSCWEDYCSGTSLATIAKDRALRAPVTSSLSSLAEIDAKAVFAAAASGDSLSSKLVDEEARWLGTGLASLAHVLNPQRVIIGGGLASAFEALHPGMRLAFEINTKPGFSDIDIVKCGLGGNSGLVGAASLVFDPI